MGGNYRWRKCWIKNWRNKTKQRRRKWKRKKNISFPYQEEWVKSLDHSVSLLRVLQYIVIAPLIKCWQPQFLKNQGRSKWRNCRLSKSHVKRVWGPQNLLKDRRDLLTFPMDANTSKYFYIYFMGIKQSLIRHWENPKRN